MAKMAKGADVLVHENEVDSMSWSYKFHKPRKTL